ncbi:MAG: glycoside hydrolase family 3 N-terminal domain-containing protein [Anaerolineales bacterium]
MRRLIFLTCTILSILVMPLGMTASAFQEQDLAAQLLADMSPEERVGQLFIVPLQGDEIDEEHQIRELIENYHISGIMLLRENDNFAKEPDTLSSIKTLIQELQEIRYLSVSPEETLLFGDVEPRAYIPLFVSISQEGGEGSYATILESLSPMPSSMAIGASWNTDHAFIAGSTLGRELEAIGVNLYLGPSLDVLVEPSATDTSGFGVRSFGGDPYWVGEMGRSFISGLHEGSFSRIAAIAKHFPGLGSSDRPIEDEVATVRKSLEQLKQFELAPFFSVTETAPGAHPSTADGLLVSHIRFQGFQGNIRATTRPVSLDPQAFAQLMNVEPLDNWRSEGGVTVSDSLGSRAIRRFRDPLEGKFNAQLVARDAFLTGNDVLLLTNFRDSEDPDEITTIKSTIEFFNQKYQEDPLFASRVDEAVLRILNMKLRLYGNSFTQLNVTRPRNPLEEIIPSDELASSVAQSSATLLNPSQDEIEDRVGPPPELGERIIFFTDVRRHRQCSNCSPVTKMDVDALENAVLRLYGPGSAGEVGGWNLRSYTMADLGNFLGETPPTDPAFPLVHSDQMEVPINAADWLIFSVLDGNEEVFGANALKLLLDKRPDLAQSKKLIVFAHDIPYLLDATDISKIDALYAIYDSGRSFVDMSARLLFQELAAPGASPVNVPGIGYDLIQATSPDPLQVISLFAYLEGGPAQETPGFSVGDIVRIETGVVVDSNGTHVPDGTVVQFNITHSGESAYTTSVESTTEKGIAGTPLTLDRTGLFSITAQSDPAQISEILQLNVQQDILAQATVISPTLIPTTTVEPTLTPELATATPESEEEVPDTGDTEAPKTVGAVHFFFGLIAVVVVGSSGYVAASRFSDAREYRFRCTLLPVIGALIGYNVIALSLPGTNQILLVTGVYSGLIVGLIGGIIGLIIALYWCRAEAQS